MLPLAPSPTDRHTVAALRVVGRALGAAAAYQRDGSFYFDAGDGWLLRLTPDSGERFRIAACYGATEVDRLWALAEDRRRLADLARGLRIEIASFVARKG